MKEADLALKFIDYFADFDIYKEVPTRGGIIDIVVDGIQVMGYESGLRVGIEVKCALNFDVIQQAINQRPSFHWTYIAVPVKYRPHSLAESICKQHGIGILGYREVGGRGNKGQITEWVRPALNRKALPVKLHDYMKRSEAGSQTNRVTSWGYWVELFTQECMRWRDVGVTPAECYKNVDYNHYRTLSLFKAAAMKYVRTGVIKNIEYRDGKFIYVKPDSQ